MRKGLDGLGLYKSRIVMDEGREHGNGGCRWLPFHAASNNDASSAYEDGGGQDGLFASIRDITASLLMLLDSTLHQEMTMYFVMAYPHHTVILLIFYPYPYPSLVLSHAFLFP